MISLRYHLLSLVAVFLALGIGILIGSAFVMREDVRSLSQHLQSEFTKVREEVRKERELSKQREEILEAYRRFSELIIPSVVKGRLAGQSIGIICIGKVNDKTISELEKIIELAGGKVSLSLSLFPAQIQSKSEEEVKNLITNLTRHIAFGNREGLREMERENLLSLRTWNGRTSRVLLISDKQADKKRVQEIDAPIISHLREANLRVVGGEEFAPSFSAIPYYKAQDIPTVDCLDYEIGQAASVLLLSGKEGNYGMGKNADALFPSL